MSRSANLVTRFSELSEKGKKYFNVVKSDGPGNPYHDVTGKFVAADDATVAAKRVKSLNKSSTPDRYTIQGWTKDKKTGEMKPKFNTPKSPAGPKVCGRTARAQGLDIRCSDGKVMSGTDKLKAAAKRVRSAKKK
jgi:hypothetical protein